MQKKKKDMIWGQTNEIHIANAVVSTIFKVNSVFNKRNG